MSQRLYLSVEIGSGVITMTVVDKKLRMHRDEATTLLKELAWAVNASANETDVKNQRMRAKVDHLYTEVA